MHTWRYAKTLRWMAAGLAFITVLAGPFASWTALAQQAPAGLEPSEAQKTGAALMNVFHVPGKAIVCTLGTAGTIGLLVLTFGSAYRRAADVFEEGCGGDWVITGEHLSGKIQRKGDLD